MVVVEAECGKQVETFGERHEEVGLYGGGIRFAVERVEDYKMSVSLYVANCLMSKIGVEAVYAYCRLTSVPYSEVGCDACTVVPCFVERWRCGVGEVYASA